MTDRFRGDDMNAISIDSDGTQGQDGRKKPRNNAATGASAAGMRAVSAQIISFYFRAPVKAFFRTRVEYVMQVADLQVLLC